jgi:hypothetical protein
MCDGNERPHARKRALKQGTDLHGEHGEHGVDDQSKKIRICFFFPAAPAFEVFVVSSEPRLLGPVESIPSLFS